MALSGEKGPTGRNGWRRQPPFAAIHAASWSVRRFTGLSTVQKVKQIQLVTKLSNILHDVVQLCCFHPLAWNENHPYRRQSIIDLAEGLPKEASCAISFDCLEAIPSRNQKRRPAHTVRRRFIDDEDTSPPGHFATGGPHLVQLPAIAISSSGGQSLAADATAVGKNLAAIASRHAGAESQLAFTMKDMRLICAFLCHGLFPYTRRVI